MKTITWGVLALAAVAPALAQDKTAEEVIAIERQALERWAKGDTRGYVEIAAPDITYFDPSAESRVDGIEAFRRHLDPIHGKFHIDHWEMTDAKVQTNGDVAVLTYHDLSRTGANESRWNVTEIYKKTPAGWRLWSSHFSFRKPKP